MHHRSVDRTTTIRLTLRQTQGDALSHSPSLYALILNLSKDEGAQRTIKLTPRGPKA
jgi:hypothetical protein